ncbi:protein LAX PANICLE 2-like [Vigna umbellata]|uniref:protein LAX PANICLE 2-like n=1 Tax=Vigna umbellata TaxID=87088 RepID=UPI001F5FB759|nr:protein LAX PANICLE 2-like [Vigna umbellata]
MTMVPSQNGKHQNINRSGDYVIYGSTTTSSAMNQIIEVEGGYNCLLGSDFVVRRHIMAEAEESSRHNNNEEAEPGGCGSTSKDEEVEGANTNTNTNTNNNNNNNWLQLGIGLTSTKEELDRTVPTTIASGPVELDLLPSRRRFDQPAAFFPVVTAGRGGGSGFGGSSSLVFEHQTTSPSSMSMASGPIASTFGHQEMMNWAFGPLLPPSMSIMPSSSSFTPLPPPPSSSSSSSSQTCHSSFRPPLGSYFPTPFHHFPSSSSSGFNQYDVAGAGPSSDVTVRVVDPPRRPHSGIWFMLQASQNQAKEPFLPQIPKNYLRIKDGRMTVRLLLKYLVSKLRLESESEIEITCRGQQLLPFLTLQHVRDNIWSLRDTTTSLLSDSSTSDHVMVLHYGRTTA